MNNPGRFYEYQTVFGNNKIIHAQKLGILSVHGGNSADDDLGAVRESQSSIVKGQRGVSNDYCSISTSEGTVETGEDVSEVGSIIKASASVTSITTKTSFHTPPFAASCSW